jgi:selenocysteine-specific translation elongation factor
MPLPAYLLEQPKTNPTDVLIRQIQNLGVDAEIARHGQTITIRDLELTEDNEDAISRALRLLETHADTNRLTVDAVVHPIQENVISRYLAAGFIVHHQADGEHGEEICTLLRRAIRN